MRRHAIAPALTGRSAFPSTSADLCKIWTVPHVPALTPLLFEGRNGMPVGLQIFVERHRDSHLFAQVLWVQRGLS
jgi:hypothetical protein